MATFLLVLYARLKCASCGKATLDKQWHPGNIFEECPLCGDELCPDCWGRGCDCKGE